ncbi:MAG: hypothetical protein IKF19_01530 [Bacilli bacterium]|nr:hypothetical protein [Bacilli bacterium]
MFDDFKNNQKFAYELLTNSVKRKTIFHAYLIDGNNNEFGFDFVMSFVKMLVCDYNYSNYDRCGDCNKCSRIDSGNYTEVKIIDTNGLIIKKDQLLELQSIFNKTAIESKRRIYIIKDCDKMNKQSSNSLLKFLEEPHNDIIAVLFTNNINGVLPTIISRCQLIKLIRKNDFDNTKVINNFANLCCNSRFELDKFTSNVMNNKMIIDVVNFLDYYEENGLDVVIYLKDMWYNSFSERDVCLLGVKLIINLYYDVFKYYFNINNYFFCEYIDIIKKISKFNNENIIINKINICIDTLESLKLNLNVNLVVDNMLINLEECKNGNS